MATGKIRERVGLRQVWRRLRGRRGLATTEYALLAGAVSVSGVAAWSHLGASVQAIVTEACRALEGWAH